MVRVKRGDRRARARGNNMVMEECRVLQVPSLKKSQLGDTSGDDLARR
jgi:hypothetical protein